MNEPEILEAYQDLGKPISPPDDVLALVDRRILRRRATRRGLAGIVTLAVVGGIGVGVLGGDEGGGQVADDLGVTDRSTLTYTDTDGSTFTFEAKDIGVACGSSEREGKAFQVLTLTLNAMLPAATQDVAPPEEAFTGPVLHVELLTEKIQPGQVFDLPYDTTNGSSDRREMTFFFTNGVDDGSNELSSAEDGSFGTVTVHEATCGPTPSLWIEIDGRLGSEEQQEPLSITGEYRS